MNSTKSLEILHKLDSGQASLKDVVMDRNTRDLLKKEHPLVQNFIIEHLNEIFDLMCADTDKQLSLNAYLILSSGNSAITRQIALNDTLNLKIMINISHKNMKPNVVSRFAQIAKVLLSSPETTDSLSFIFLLLKYPDNLDVYYLFKSIWFPCEIFSQASKIMGKMRLGEFVINEMKSIDLENANPEDFNDPEYVRLMYYFELLSFGARNPDLKPTFVGMDVIFSITKYQDLPYFVDNSKWRAIKAICAIEDIKNLCFFEEQARKILSEDVPVLHEFHVDVIEFYVVLIDRVRKFSDIFVLQRILFLLTRFQSNTILLRSIAKIVRECLNIPKFCTQIAMIYLPVLLQLAKSRPCNAVASISTQIIKFIAIRGKDDKDLNNFLSHYQEFNAFVTTDLSHFIKIKNEPYGGKVERISFLAMFET